MPKLYGTCERINVFLSVATMEKLRKIAKERETSISALVRGIVLDYLSRLNGKSVSTIESD